MGNMILQQNLLVYEASKYSKKGYMACNVESLSVVHVALLKCNYPIMQMDNRVRYRLCSVTLHV